MISLSSLEALRHPCGASATTITGMIACAHPSFRTAERTCCSTVWANGAFWRPQTGSAADHRHGNCPPCGGCASGPRSPVRGCTEIPSFEECLQDKRAYAAAFLTQYREQDPVRGKALMQRHGNGTSCKARPDLPLTREELDASYTLPSPAHVAPGLRRRGRRAGD